ncbi:MAG: SUMF1/EgtB/PvdO family nonheme iron enzyme [Steroidobacteraceae bacterium]
MTTPSPDIFLSYCRDDQASARVYAEALQSEGFRVWWDQSLSVGEAYDEVTERALEGARAVVVLWSKKSVASRWVRAEATTADRNKVLAPVMIEACKRPIMFELTQSADLSGWKGNREDPAWRSFVGDIGRLVGRGERQPPPGADEHLSGSGVSIPPVVSQNSRGARNSKVFVAIGAAVALAALAGGYWLLQRSTSQKEAREAIQQISKLADANKYHEAFALAQRARRVLPDDAMLKSLTPIFTGAYSVNSTPSEVEVYLRAYDDVNGEWQHVGRTPLERVEMPRGALRWRFEKPGYTTVERANSALADRLVAGAFLTDAAGKLDVTLHKVGDQPAGMIFVPAGRVSVKRLESVDVPAFYIDRTEVTNAAFKAFIDAGGYERRAFWDGLDIRNGGKPLVFDDAMKLFVDETGRQGPASWELGSYPAGEGDLPVTGVSWYEAEAYARYRGLALPTAFHWHSAALLPDEGADSLAAFIAPLSNLGSGGPEPVARRQGMGPYGTYDMFGNVREWISNFRGSKGWAVGGYWEDAVYSYRDMASVSLSDRSPFTGFRLIKSIGEPGNARHLNAELDFSRSIRPPSQIKPVSDEVYATFQRQFAYQPGPLDASAPMETASTEDWIKQRVSFNTGYNNERMDAILFVPKRGNPPFQPVILMSGIQTVLFPGKSEDIEPGFSVMPLDYVVKSGRMLVQPIFQGSYERFKSRMDIRDEIRTNREWIERRWDLGRTIDYLETRPDVDAKRLGYIGISFGGSTAIPLLALEPRLKAAVLLSGGLDNSTLSPLIDGVNHAPRVRIPVLMVNGRYDEILSVEDAQKPLFRLLGTPDKDKRHVVLEYGHGSPPRAQVLMETLGWFDKYLGPVRR